MGAIVTEQGKPRVVPDLCTGCRVCQMVCPAPKNAIFTVASKPKKGMIGRWEENRVDLDEQLGSEPDADAGS
ncbi:4Fe-4S binding protein [Haloferula rosea]|uniref:4Fe-4S binding protein n=2 Tax=Haloferula rosea TaxID=490093 RepID=A0A934RAM2_9BACT|nr:4Fe-4S binding protein [Haloferula rosea]